VTTSNGYSEYTGIYTLVPPSISNFKYQPIYTNGTYFMWPLYLDADPSFVWNISSQIGTQGPIVNTNQSPLTAFTGEAGSQNYPVTPTPITTKVYNSTGTSGSSWKNHAF
jgi:hypothetical protein